MREQKSEFYQLLQQQAQSLIEDETDLIANMANLSALLFNEMPDLNWSGFYILRQGELVLGPFQGKPACVRIPVGKGVCGTAVATGDIQLVKDVHEFPGHIACSSLSRSEIVVPLIHNGAVVGVLDVDSSELDQFDETDKLYLEKIVSLINW